MQNAKTATHDHGLFRRVMGSFATGVTVITTEARGEVRGMTANAFMSGSLEPPLCLVSVGKRARLHPLLIEAGHFGVSILAKDQEKLSTHFAGGPVADIPPQFVYIGRTPVLANVSAIIDSELSHPRLRRSHHSSAAWCTWTPSTVASHRARGAVRLAHLFHGASAEWVADFW